MPPKQRPKSVPVLNYYVDKVNNLIITTDRLATYVWIYQRKNNSYLPLHLSDNYFTLLPNETKSINVGNAPHGEIFVTCYEIEKNKA